MPRYAIIVEGTARIRETWAVVRDTPPTPDEAADLLFGGPEEAEGEGSGAEFVSDEVIGDEERDYSTIKIEEF